MKNSGSCQQKLLEDVQVGWKVPRSPSRYTKAGFSNVLCCISSGYYVLKKTHYLKGLCVEVALLVFLPLFFVVLLFLFFSFPLRNCHMKPWNLPCFCASDLTRKKKQRRFQKPPKTAWKLGLVDFSVVLTQLLYVLTYRDTFPDRPWKYDGWKTSFLLVPSNFSWGYV